MKKALIILLSLALILSLAACGGKTPTDSSEASESGGSSADEAKAEEVKLYGIGEAGEDDGFEITIDKVEIIDNPTDILWEYAEGYKYVKVFATVKNIGEESQTTNEPLLSIVREDVDDSGLSNYSRNKDVVKHMVEGIYYKEYIAPGESISGFEVFQLKPDENEIIMKYDTLLDTDARFKVQIP